MGLTHPRDLDAWRRWSASRRPVAHLAGRVRSTLRADSGAAGASLTAYVRGDDPAMLVALESASPSNVAANLRFLERTDGAAAVLAPAPIARLDADPAFRRAEVREATDAARVVLASGAYLPVGAFAEGVARDRRIPFAVVQHGLMTPKAPPLPEGAHLLAASDADAEFWRSGRDDVTTETVGLQLLWDAARDARRPSSGPRDGRLETPVFLGQLHGIELPRREVARTSLAVCRATGARYRPHPGERDRLSRLQHAAWRRRGLVFDRRPLALAELAAPVIATFSTGILEAAARGLPAWSAFAGTPPRWLEEFWDRYGMRRLDLDGPRRRDGLLDLDAQLPATPAPALPDVEPALATARALERLAGVSAR